MNFLNNVPYIVITISVVHHLEQDQVSIIEKSNQLWFDDTPLMPSFRDRC